MDEVRSTAPMVPEHREGATAFAALVHAHTQELLRFARKRLNDPLIAEDIVQTTFLAAWEARERFAQQSSPRTWLFSILKNKLADHYRKAYRDPEVHGALDTDDERFDQYGRWKEGHRPSNWDVDDAHEAETLQRYLTYCLEYLPTHWRAAVEMKYLKDLDAAVVCQELGITATNYWQQLHRAKLKLRDCISKQIAANQ